LSEYTYPVDWRRWIVGWVCCRLSDKTDGNSVMVAVEMVRAKIP